MGKTRFLEISLDELTERSQFIFTVKNSPQNIIKKTIDTYEGKKIYHPFEQKISFYEIIEQLYPQKSSVLLNKRITVFEPYLREKLSFSALHLADQGKKTLVFDRFKVFSQEFDRMQRKLIFLRYTPHFKTFQLSTEGAVESETDKNKVLNVIAHKINNQTDSTKQRINGLINHINSLFLIDKLNQIEEFALPDIWYKISMNKSWINRFFSSLFSSNKPVLSKGEILQKLYTQYPDKNLIRSSHIKNKHDVCMRCNKKINLSTTTISSLQKQNFISFQENMLHAIHEHQSSFTSEALHILHTLLLS